MNWNTSNTLQRMSLLEMSVIEAVEMSLRKAS